jgi:hypothetical protein
MTDDLNVWEAMTGCRKVDIFYGSFMGPPATSGTIRFKGRLTKRASLPHA